MASVNLSANMLISVIIPTCNRNDLLGKCLEKLQYGIQNLSMDEYEVIVSDDGIGNAAKEFIATSFPWAKWVEGPKRGPAANRNNGAKHAEGEWLVFVDDDVIPDNLLLQNYLKSINNFSNA